MILPSFSVTSSVVISSGVLVFSDSVVKVAVIGCDLSSLSSLVLMLLCGCELIADDESGTAGGAVVGVADAVLGAVFDFTPFEPTALPVNDNIRR